MAIKYWLRITTGTQNRLWNEAYKTAIHEKHNWVQCIQALLNTHGFGDVWLNPFIAISSFHDDVIKWKHFQRYWPFVRGIHRSPVNSPHNGQWRGALMFTLICARINGWVNNREAGDLRRHRDHYDVNVMRYFIEESYIFKIRNPCIRKIFTLLRIDMNVLSTCRINKTIVPACPLCSGEPESVLHFVFNCVVCMIDSAFFLFTKLFRVHRLSRI